MGVEVSFPLFDLLLVVLLAALAGGALFGADLFRSIVFFIVFGLLMALAWARLRAPDLALAEAAVGAGVTGALLLAGWQRMAPDADPGAEAARIPPLSALAVGAALALVGAGVVWALFERPGAGLGEAVRGRLVESGVESPVTAVLLNFRGYDTLLEVALLLLAAVAVQAVGTPGGRGIPPAPPVLTAFAAWLAPMLVVTAGYLLWRGGHAPGGAFQAGALLAGAGILLVMVFPPMRGVVGDVRVRLLLLLGPALFLGVAALTMGSGGFLEYPPPWAGALILMIEAAATLSIAGALLMLFLGAMGSGEEEP